MAAKTQFFLKDGEPFVRAEEAGVVVHPATDEDRAANERAWDRFMGENPDFAVTFKAQQEREAKVAKNRQRWRDARMRKHQNLAPAKEMAEIEKNQRAAAAKAKAPKPAQKKAAKKGSK